MIEPGTNQERFTNRSISCHGTVSKPCHDTVSKSCHESRTIFEKPKPISSKFGSIKSCRLCHNQSPALLYPRHESVDVFFVSSVSSVGSVSFVKLRFIFY
jgi:hypothetical protein